MFQKLIFLFVIFCSIFEGGESGLLSRKESRIIGGEEVLEREFPFIVSIHRGKTHICAGTIIDHRWVLSAAHCFVSLYGNPPSPRYYTIYAGSDELPYVRKATEKRKESEKEKGKGVINNKIEDDENDLEESKQERKISQIFLHPQWRSEGSGLAYDIALLKMSSSFIFNEKISKIELPEEGFDPSNGTATVAGWGIESNKLKHGSKIMRKVEVPIVSDEECKSNYTEVLKEEGHDLGVVESMLCGGSKGKDACRLDSGGPLMCPKDKTKFAKDVKDYKEMVQCGIISWGNGCGLENFPGVYTEVSWFLDFIEDTISENYLN